MYKFKLSEHFVEKYKKIKPPFGFNGLGEIVYRRTYSRMKKDGTNEEWYETVERVVNGTYTMQRNWIEQHSLGWNAWQAQKSAQEMYDRIFYMKFLPPGRGLWAMGSPITEEKGLYAALNNCAFVSTANLKDDPAKPFIFLMDASMLGVGVGFDTKGAGTVTVKGQNMSRRTEQYTIPDTREGWVESVKLLIESFFLGTAPLDFDYSEIRKAGEQIKGFGGISSGPEPLKKLHENIIKVLTSHVGQPITIRGIVDLMNMIGQCVVSGNVRRSAEIVFGDPDIDEYLDLKDYNKNPDRADYGWTSNNSIFAKVGMEYDSVVERTRINGEPGYIWLDNMQNYSRMCDSPDLKDHRASGCNPCFSGDTLIAVADGRVSVPIKQLAEENIDILVESVDENGNRVKKTGRNPRITQKNQQLYKIILGDDSYIRATANHEFMLDNLKMVRVDELEEGNVFALGNSVKKIEKDNVEDVYCLTVDDTHKVCVYSMNDSKQEVNLVAASNCSEQTLEPYELCCLVETFPNNHETLEDYLRTLKFAYLYAKTVTLGKTHWPETNRVLLRNRRIGCSMSGLAQFLTNKGIHTFKTWAEQGYGVIQEWDRIYSDWLAIPRSIKTTSIKPSGSISLLVGATPGMHYPESLHYIRRVRIAKDSDLIGPLEKAGYMIEPAAEDPDNTVVVEFPVGLEENIRTVSEISIWEQMSLAALIQKYWADNQVSCTISFDPEKEGHQIKFALDYFQYQLKGVSFLPKTKKGAYPQMPYEAINKQKYEETMKKLKPIRFKKIKNEIAEVEKFCDGDSCSLPLSKENKKPD